MAGRDARPTIVNISPYLKTPDLGGLLHRADTWVRAVHKSLPDINIPELFCLGGAGVPACDSSLAAPLNAVNGGQGRPPHYCEHVALSQNPRAHYRTSIFPVGADPRVRPILPVLIFQTIPNRN